MNTDYDLIVIGSGPGGYVAALRASKLGMKVAVVEKELLGGICLNWGCIPTKALLKSAQVLNYTKHAADYGISCNAQMDFEKIILRSRNISSTMSKGIEFLLKKNNVDVINGFASFCTTNTIEVDNNNEKHKFSAKRIIIATGARSRSLANAAIDGKKIIGYRQALTLAKQPKSMLIIGSGAIGSELAYFYNTIGTQVTLVEFLPAIVPNEDDDVSMQLNRSFRKNGIKIMTDSSVENVDTSGDVCNVSIKTKKGIENVEVETVLSAVGITPNIEDLNLEKIGIEIDRGKIKTDKYYQTNIKNIYAIGDVIATPALAHVASAEAITCVEKIAGKDVKPVNYNNIPACIYTSPEIASVGLTEKRAVAEGYKIKTGKFPFTASGKAAAIGERDGFIKLIFDNQTDKLLGAHCIGANVTEIIAGIVTAINIDVKAHDIIKSIHPHPTISEAIMEAAALACDEAVNI
ncbi:MAG: dihydrolipoyl dehydrogenase [Prevotellaceae bacterium]|jgi:dihydrolipoamide dehydrogenase|nr:dihydrolipoyl dehydrogenase [Prevotellaceae bacterium]